MSRAIRVPVVDSTSDEVYLSDWVKVVGDRLAEGEPIARLETDKASVDIVAPASGVLTAILLHEGDVEPGTVIAEMNEE